MGEVLFCIIPRGRTIHTPWAAAREQRWHLGDIVELPGEDRVNGWPQRGVIERLMIDGTAGMFWIRLSGGPRGGNLLVVEGHRLQRSTSALPPLSHG